MIDSFELTEADVEAVAAGNAERASNDADKLLGYVLRVVENREHLTVVELVDMAKLAIDTTSPTGAQLKETYEQKLGALLDVRQGDLNPSQALWNPSLAVCHAVLNRQAEI